MPLMKTPRNIKVLLSLPLAEMSPAEMLRIGTYNARLEWEASQKAANAQTDEGWAWSQFLRGVYLDLANARA